MTRPYHSYDPVLVSTTTVDGNGISTVTVTGQDFTATTPMATARNGHSATRLADGRVVVAGGNTTQTEVYDPAAATWTTQSPTAATHTSHAAILLSDGRLLVVGGTQFAQQIDDRSFRRRVNSSEWLIHQIQIGVLN